MYVFKRFNVLFFVKDTHVAFILGKMPLLIEQHEHRNLSSEKPSQMLISFSINMTFPEETCKISW
jgi:hypothetical protein